MRRKKVYFLFFIGCLLITGDFPVFSSPVSPIADTVVSKPLPETEGTIKAPVHYTAVDSMRFDIENQKVYLFGDAQVEYETTKLNADYIELDIRSNIVFAEGVKDSLGNEQGLPVFSDKDKSFKSRKMTYNFETKKGRIIEVITKEADGYVHGETVKKDTSNTYYIKNGKYTTCDLPHPHFYIASNKLKVIPQDKIVTGPAYLVIMDVPTPLGLPFGLFPSKQGQRSGILIPTYGESVNQGYFLQDGGYYFGLSDYVDMAIRGDIYSRGSWGLKLASNYNNRYDYNGNVNIRYSNFTIGEPELPNYIQSKDFFVSWSHNQDPRSRPDSRFSANVNAGSSSYNQLNNRSPNFYLTNTFQSNIGYVKTWLGTPHNLSVNLRHSQNTITKNFDISLPEVTYTINRGFPLKRKNSPGTKWYEKIGVSYTANARNDINTYDSLLFKETTYQRMKNGMNHSIPIATNFNVLKVFNVTPSLNFSSRWYLQSIEKKWNPSRKQIVTDTVHGLAMGHDGSFSISANTRLYGMYVFRSERLKAIRHVISPTVSFSYRPDFSEEHWGYYKKVQTDSTGLVSQKYSIFENGIFGGPSSGNFSNINFSINNNLEMKVRSRKDTTGTDKKVTLLEGLSFSSAYNMATHQFQWSPTTIAARTRLFNKVDVNLGGTIDPYALDNTGRRIDYFEWTKNKKPGRFTSGSANISTNLRNDGNSRKKQSNRGAQSEVDYINAHPEAYVDFTVPWSLYVSYNIQYSKPALTEQVVQTFAFNGDVNVTSKWKVGFTSGYDFINKSLSYTTVSIYRDLHCWDMSISWIPFGRQQSYELNIKVKSAVLQDLRLTRRRLWFDYN